MTTKANRQRAKRKKPEMQSDDVYIPSSLKKARFNWDEAESAKVCHGCSRDPCECNQGRGKALNDPLGDLCGEPWHPVVIYAISASIAFCGGLGMGWLVWA